MRCEAQDAPCGKPHKRRATKQRARIRQGKLGSLFLATSLGLISSHFGVLPASRQLLYAELACSPRGI